MSKRTRTSFPKLPIGTKVRVSRQRVHSYRPKHWTGRVGRIVDHFRCAAGCMWQHGVKFADRKGKLEELEVIR